MQNKLKRHARISHQSNIHTPTQQTWPYRLSLCFNGHFPPYMNVFVCSYYIFALIIQRKFHRKLLMYGFHFLVSCLCVKNVRDTQCGFKLFTRKAACLIFRNQHLQRWCFDVELLYLAQKHFGIPIVEVAVNWTEIPGSKIDVFRESFNMGRDMVLVRFLYMFRVWRVKKKRNRQDIEHEKKE